MRRPPCITQARVLISIPHLWNKALHVIYWLCCTKRLIPECSWECVRLCNDKLWSTQCIQLKIMRLRCADRVTDDVTSLDRSTSFPTYRKQKERNIRSGKPWNMWPHCRLGGTSHMTFWFHGICDLLVLWDIMWTIFTLQLHITKLDWSESHSKTLCGTLIRAEANMVINDLVVN